MGVRKKGVLSPLFHARETAGDDFAGINQFSPGTVSCHFYIYLGMGGWVCSLRHLSTKLHVPCFPRYIYIYIHMQNLTATIPNYDDRYSFIDAKKVNSFFIYNTLSMKLHSFGNNSGLAEQRKQRPKYSFAVPSITASVLNNSINYTDFDHFNCFSHPHPARGQVGNREIENANSLTELNKVISNYAPHSITPSDQKPVCRRTVHVENDRLSTDRVPDEQARFGNMPINLPTAHKLKPNLHNIIYQYLYGSIYFGHQSVWPPWIQLRIEARARTPGKEEHTQFFKHLGAITSTQSRPIGIGGFVTAPRSSVVQQQSYTFNTGGCVPPNTLCTSISMMWYSRVYHTHTTCLSSSV